MPRTFQDAVEYDVSNAFLDTGTFAQSITLTQPDSAGTTLTINQMLAMLDLMPTPDGDISGPDRLHFLDLFRTGEISAASSTVNAIVDQDNLDAIQGMGLDSEFGRSIEEFAILELAASVTITCEEKPENCTYATIDGERWSCVRVLGRDSAMQSVAALRQGKVTTKRTRPKP